MNAKHQETRTLLEESFQSLLAQVQAGKSEKLQEFLAFSSRFHKYSPNNQMLIFVQNPQATFVAGYKRWQELGYQVKKGEHGIGILAPCTYKDKETEESVVKGFRVAHVFDAAQLTDDKPLPQFWQPLPDDSEELYEKVKGAVESCDIQIETGSLPGGVQGESLDKKIVLADGRDSRSRTLTLVHEWAHEVMHKQEDRSKTTKAERELQAESVAYVVCKHLGLESPFSSDYLLTYGSTVESLVGNLGQIHKAAHFMLGKLENNDGRTSIT